MTLASYINSVVTSRNIAGIHIAHSGSMYCVLMQHGSGYAEITGTAKHVYHMFHSVLRENAWGRNSNSQRK